MWKIKIFVASVIVALSTFGAILPATPVAAVPCFVNGKNIGNIPADDCKAAQDAASTNVTGNASEGDFADETAFSFGSCGNRNVGINCLVVEVMKFMSILVGVAVVGGIVIGGINYSTSEGNPGKAQKGITIITNSIIGLLLYIFMFAIINFLVPGGILS